MEWHCVEGIQRGAYPLSASQPGPSDQGATSPDLSPSTWDSRLNEATVTL
jgi:hypothetical protein